MLNEMFTSDVLYYAARESAMEALATGKDAASAALELITTLAQDNDLPISAIEAKSLATKAAANLELREWEELDLAS